MIKDRRFSLIFRLFSFILATIGLLKQIGVFQGVIGYRAFMYYTIQSNLFAIILFGYLCAKTAKSIKQNIYGNSSWLPRIGMICAVDIFLTFIVFWAMLVPQGMSVEYLLSFENLAVHAITPLLCFLDYILFSEARRLKYRDVYYVCIFPLLYVIFTTIAGLSGYVYRYEGVVSSQFSNSIEAVPVRFPYYFLDFDKLGMTVFAYIGGLLVFFMLLGHLIYFIDHKVRKKP